MRAVRKYKAMVDEVGRMMMVFANIDKFPILAQSWTLADIEKAQVDVMNYANTAADQIRGELIGDGNEVEFRGRLKTAFFELGADPNFAPSFFSLFNEALFELPSKDYPDRSKEMVDALTDVYGSDAGKVMLALQVLLQWANFIVAEVSKMLDEVCKFVGYTPELQEQTQEATNTDSLAVEQQEPQRGEQEQQKDLHYYCHKAIEKGYFVKVDDGYRIKNREWTKAQLAYFLNHFLNADGTFPDKEYCVMFGESRLSKAAYQLVNNKNGDGKPRGYEIVDELLQG